MTAFRKVLLAWSFAALLWGCSGKARVDNGSELAGHAGSSDRANGSGDLAAGGAQAGTSGRGDDAASNGGDRAANAGDQPAGAGGDSSGSVGGSPSAGAGGKASSGSVSSDIQACHDTDECIDSYAQTHPLATVWCKLPGTPIPDATCSTPQWCGRCDCPTPTSEAEACESDTDCTNGVCSVIDGQCVVQCSASLPCGVGTKCNAAQRCEPVKCQSDIECPNRFACTNGQCLRKACTSDAMCEDGGCVNSACYDSLGTCYVRRAP